MVLDPHPHEPPGPRARRTKTTRQPDFRRLAAHLGPRPGRTVTLTFTEIERALGTPLPLDAYERRQWWLSWGGGAGRHQPAGWRIQSVDVLGHLATFGREQL